MRYNVASYDVNQYMISMWSMIGLLGLDGDDSVNYLLLGSLIGQDDCDLTDCYCGLIGRSRT